MRRMYLTVKIIWSGPIWAAFGLAGLLLLFACRLKAWHFVEQTRLEHLIAFYEIGFALVPVFLFSQLFAEETEEGVFRWLSSLSFNRLRWAGERWLMGMVLLIALYLGSLSVLNLAVMPLPWGTFVWKVFVPSLWLGHLSLAAALLFRHSGAGIAVPLIHWVIEVLSRGQLTGRWYLFDTAMPMGDIAGNRLLYAILAAAALSVSLWMIKRMSHF